MQRLLSGVSVVGRLAEGTSFWERDKPRGQTVRCPYPQRVPRCLVRIPTPDQARVGDRIVRGLKGAPGD